MDSTIEDLINRNNKVMSRRVFSSIKFDENMNWLSFNEDEVNGDSLPAPRVTKSELDVELDDIHYEVLRHYQHRTILINGKKRVTRLYY